MISPIPKFLIEHEQGLVGTPTFDDLFLHKEARDLRSKIIKELDNKKLLFGYGADVLKLISIIGTTGTGTTSLGQAFINHISNTLGYRIFEVNHLMWFQSNDETPTKHWDRQKKLTDFAYEIGPKIIWIDDLHLLCNNHASKCMWRLLLKNVPGNTVLVITYGITDIVNSHSTNDIILQQLLTASSAYSVCLYLDFALLPDRVLWFKHFITMLCKSWKIKTKSTIPNNQLIDDIDYKTINHAKKIFKEKQPKRIDGLIRYAYKMMILSDQSSSIEDIIENMIQHDSKLN